MDRWIPVSRDVPDDDIEVLCCCAPRELLWVGYRSGGDWLKTDSSGDIVMTSYVSHWMELPEVPE